MTFETPEAPRGAVSTYAITLPSEVGFLRLMLGALSELTEDGNWQEVGIPAGEAIEVFAEAIANVKKARSHIGTFVPTYLTVAPPGYILCVGGVYAQADYPELMADYPAALKVGANFYAPDFRSRGIVGAGQYPGMSNWPLLSFTTNEAVTLTVNNLPPHTHGYNLATSIPTAAGELPTLASEVTVTPATTGSTGNGTPFDIRPSAIALNWLLVAKDYI